MSHLYDELPDQKPPQTLWSGKIANNISDFADLLSVVIPGIDENVRWENCKWQARNDTDIPHRGDSCLVAFDDNNQLWVVAWWPF